MQQLYVAGRLALVCNMGTLVEPITRDEYLAGAPRPFQLFSHQDQQQQQQTAVSLGSSQTGWGGRLADRIHSTELFPIQISVAGVAIFNAALAERPLIVPSTGPLNQALPFQLPRAQTASAVNALLALDEGSPFRRASDRLAQQAIATQAQLTDEPPVGSFPNTPLGNQLKQISKFIALHNVLSAGQPMRRQIFLAALGGFDTHSNQNTDQGNLLTQLSEAVSAFQAELDRRAVQDQVTTFTLSDFSRTFKVGTAATGTDHAWGSHQIVAGGAVRGGDLYGTYPNLTPNGTDDLDAGADARGRWIPTTSVDQFGATLAKWFGVSDDDMSLVFPNIDRFSPAELGFMKP